MSEDFVREWALKWAEGTILGFARGGIELNRAVGMLRTAVGIIGNNTLYDIITNIEKNPVYLPAMSQKEKAAKLKPLREGLK